MYYSPHTYLVLLRPCYLLQVLLIFLSSASRAQTPAFADISSQLPNLPEINNGSTDWGDYDNDGRLDLLMTGHGINGAIFRLYHNTPQGFVDVSSLAVGMKGADNSVVSWGDYDNDGRLDFMVTGVNFGIGYNETSYWPFVNELYHNTGSNFVSVTSLLTGNYISVSGGSIAWVDYNNDGYQDLQVSGTTRGGHGDQLFHNNGGRNFSKKEHTVPVLNSESWWENSYVWLVKWVDYDSDGRMDVFFIDAGGKKTYLYRNTPQGFEDVSSLVASIPATGSKMDWGDFDNDGRIDVVIIGSGTKLYRNTAQGFVNASNLVPDLPQLKEGMLAWGDYDNDGWLDLFVAGILNSGARVSKLLRNNSPTFTDVSNLIPDLPQLGDGSASWGDYDKDGRLDLLLTGKTQSSVLISRLYHNISAKINTPPNTPEGLHAGASADGKSITFTWLAASDAQTPALGLSYNLYVSDKPGSQTAVSAMADVSTGLRRVVRVGNCQATSYTLTGLTPNKTYYWSVQAIDAAWSGSGFAPQQSVCTCQPLAINAVTTLKCQHLTASKRQVTFTPNYSGLSNEPLSFSVVNELSQTLDPGPYALDLYTDNPVIILTAQQGNQSTTFIYDWLAACLSKEPTTSSDLSITAVTTLSCQVLSPVERRLTFTPQYAGVSGQPISFSVVNELVATTSPGPYSLNLYTDNPSITLSAQQGTTISTYRYNWLAVCSSAARVSAGEAGSGLQVKLLGNPVEGSTAEMEISGASGHAVQLNLVDLQGKPVHAHRIEQAGALERVSLPLGASNGALLLRVSTPVQHQQVKLLRTN